MNRFKLLLVGALALASVATMSAQTVVNITGSTAFRASVHARILASLTNPTYAYTGTDINAASQANFAGTISGNPYVFRTSFSGSVAGVQAIVQAANVNFIPSTTVGSAAGTPSTPAGTDPALADVAMSDVYQSSTGFRTPALTDNIVAVVPFVFVANDGSPAGLNNITPQLFQNMFAAGGASLQLFTGNTADLNTTVYAVGRSTGSGTRVTALAETGYGIFKNVVQVTLNIDGTGEVTGFNDVGNAGYGSGGAEAIGLAGHSTAAIGFFIGYLGEEDAALTAVPGGAKRLSYNGVPYSVANVQNGNYTFWGYEHMYYTPSLAGAKLTGANTVRNSIIAVPGVSGIALGTMKVARQTDGGNVGVL